jgi:hypothetical protein
MLVQPIKTPVWNVQNQISTKVSENGDVTPVEQSRKNSSNEEANINNKN